MSEPFTQAQYDGLLRADFAGFAHRAFLELNPRAEFATNWHFEAMAAKLAAVRAGRIGRLIINVPPRHLKSHLASVAFPAWCLGHDPSAQIVCASYAQDFADKLARDCRRLMTSDCYQRLFPTRLSVQRQAVSEFETTAQGCRLATSVGGVLTGRGADIIIIDDPLKPEEALSQTQRQAANEWFDHTLYSRLNDKRKGAIILIMHRLHEDDLVGHVLAQEPWEVVRFPAIAEDDETHEIEAVVESRCVIRRRGEALHPVREPLPMLEQIRRTIGEYNFAGQYQQMPAPLGGGLVKADWFKRYPPDERLPFDRVVQSWDTASKASELSDFSVCTSWGILDKDLYLIDVLRSRMEYPELKRAVRAQYERFRPSVVLIEDKASGTQLIQELIRDGMYAVTRYQPQTDKVMRMHAQTAMIENGFVHLPDTAPWLAPYLHELTAFPKGRHDDQVDSTAQMLDWFKRGSGPSSNAGIFELYRIRAEEARGQQVQRNRRVRLRVPPGIGHRNLLLLNVGPDGTCEMLESEAESFLRAGWERVETGKPPG
ncbi:MAG TPA: phage terminase large subunit [Stellaceae bacterium]|nr:phage terminase large subunit [Stellaceae bacterium]